MITKIPVAEGFHAGSGTVPTGPIQIGSDWPGFFIRGDDCGSRADLFIRASSYLKVLREEWVKHHGTAREIEAIEVMLLDTGKEFMTSQVHYQKEIHDAEQSQ